MSMYAIQDTTLTALGDAVRSKLGFNEVKKTQTPTLINYNDMIKIELPAQVSKAKVVGHCYSTTNTISSMFQGLGYGIGTNYRIGNEVRISADYTLIINESNNYLDENFEIIINSNSFTFVPSYNATINPITVSFEIISLDENGNEFKYTPLEMVDKINGLMAIPDEALNITGDCSYRFSNNGWDWFINQCGDKITTNNITDTQYMFYETGLKTVPFDINIASNISNLQNTFTYATKLEVVPYIVGPEKKPPTSSYSGTLNISYLFNNCQRLRYIPKDYFWKMVPNKDFWETQANIGPQGQDTIFGYCNSLRELPDISMIGGNWTSSYSCIYYNLLQFCYSLDEAINIPVYGTFTSNAMGNLFYNNYRLKDFEFAVNEDGTPKTANWKNQTIDFTSKGTIGYGNYTPTSYNSGITADKRVKDDATYQALKNDPDWYSKDINYSRYNHNSAVRTINSLPDTSAYLTANGGTNAIKFKGQSGASTDGGAINTLTEEEIAVATAKGWTVSLV